jgi:hypothetical protein
MRRPQQGDETSELILKKINLTQSPFFNVREAAKWGLRL